MQRLSSPTATDVPATSPHLLPPDASHLFAAPRSSPQIAPGLPKSRRALSGPAKLQMLMPPKPRMLPALLLIFFPKLSLPVPRQNLVHREGFEPSYLRGGADLQSAGFNHSPTCAVAVSVEQRALSNHLRLAHSSQLEALSDTPQPSLRLHLAIGIRKCA